MEYTLTENEKKLNNLYKRQIEESSCLDGLKETLKELEEEVKWTEDEDDKYYLDYDIQNVETDIDWAENRLKDLEYEFHQIFDKDNEMLKLAQKFEAWRNSVKITEEEYKKYLNK